MHQMCKHKVALLKGDAKMLYDSSQEPILKQVLSSDAYPAIKARLERYQKQLAGVHRQIAKFKEKGKAIREAFAYELAHGKQSPNAIPEGKGKRGSKFVYNRYLPPQQSIHRTKTHRAGGTGP